MEVSHFWKVFEPHEVLPVVFLCHHLRNLKNKESGWHNFKILEENDLISECWENQINFYFFLNFVCYVNKQQHLWRKIFVAYSLLCFFFASGSKILLDNCVSGAWKILDFKLFIIYCCKQIFMRLFKSHSMYNNGTRELYWREPSVTPFYKPDGTISSITDSNRW